MRTLTLAIGLVLVSCMLLICGCGEARQSADDIRASWNNTNMERVISLYIKYQRSHVFRGPASEKVFKAYISSLDADRLASINVESDKVDELFFSERDSEPFEIRYKQKGGDRTPPVPIVFEKVGVDGVRKVGFNTRKIIDVDNEQGYQDLLAGKQLVGAGN